MNIPDLRSSSLISQFNEAGHWYTSFPSLNHWTEDFPDYEKAFLESCELPLHLYLHIPFCKKLCHYCICNIVITNDRSKIQFFLDYLLKEIDNLKGFYEKHGKIPRIEEIHFGGGTPSHLDRVQFESLCHSLRTVVDFGRLREVAMEVDPRTVEEEDLLFYAAQGVTRVSFGIQDFDLRVQEAINRVQPPEMIEKLLTPRVRETFKGMNFDLLYGLPLQTRETLSETVEKVLFFAPERITLLKYCHAPEIRRHMKLINVTDLPVEEELPLMFLDTVETLTRNGYLWVGLDHFAKKGDSLAQSFEQGKMVRTFNGFKPGPVKDMIGLGPTSTHAFQRFYFQNHYDLNCYYQSVNEGRFPVLRGYELTHEDQLRREAIFSLLCARDLSLSARLLLRNLCKVFDNKDTEPEHMKIAQKTITRKIA